MSIGHLNKKVDLCAILVLDHQHLAQEEFFFLVTTTAVDLAQRFNVCGPMRGSVAGRHQGAIGGQGRCTITVGRYGH